MPVGEDPDSLIRKDGTEAFNERIAKAREFFDYWIDRVAAATDLSSLSAKMQLARQLAETIARVHDPLMRSEVISKVTARLGVSARDFETLLPRPQRERPSEEVPRSATPAPRHEIAMLCLLALRDTAAREFLSGQNWRDVIAQTPGAEFLARILESDLRPEDPASLNVFMASLSGAEESLVSSWLLQKIPPNPEAVARDWWNGLRQAGLRRQLQEAESRMKLPQLTTGEVVNLQKQIVDFRDQLHELRKFSPARVLDL
jgi:DNA primase